MFNCNTVKKVCVSEDTSPSSLFMKNVNILEIKK